MEIELGLNEKEKETARMIRSQMPHIIIDSHVHCSPKKRGQALINEAASIPGNMFNFFPWGKHRSFFRRVFCDLQYIATTLGFPGKDESNNAYILHLSRTYKNCIPIFLSSNLPEKGWGRLFAGLKMYPSSRQKSSAESKISDVFPEGALKSADRSKRAIILHLPRDIFSHIEELLALAAKYPGISFIIAHMGNIYKDRKDMGDILGTIKPAKNILFDTAMITDAQLIGRTIAKLGCGRLLFGSDAPFSYIRGRYFEAENKIRLQSLIKFSWVNTAEHCDYEKEAKNFKLIHLNIIEAILGAVKEVFGETSRQRTAKEFIFHANAKNIFQGRD
ncbi:MAG: amidohydrolase family protein [Candidatus Portnoybacteria bacterium]|nr:amidohydrolase family protein [Candidatus Portnoybacteria bacterium]